MQKYYNVYKLLPYGQYVIDFLDNTVFEGCVASILNKDGLQNSVFIDKNTKFYFKAIKLNNNEDLKNYYNLIPNRKYKIENGNIELLPFKWYENSKIFNFLKWIKNKSSYIINIIITSFITATITVYYNEIIAFLSALI